MKLALALLSALTLIVGAPTALAANVEIAAVTLPATDSGHAMPVRIFWRQGLRRGPVVVFSHGAYSANNLYDPILTPWAEAGMVVLAPTHRDSTSLGVARGTNDPRYFAWRLDDMQRLLQGLDALELRIAALNGRLDRSRIGATGHSFGGLVAQTLAGATFADPVSQQPQSRRHEAVRAVIIFSGAGRFVPLLADANFAALTLPTLVTVGSEDLQQAPGLTGYQWRREPFDLIGSSERWLLTLKGADHYLGGSIGRSDLPVAPQSRGWIDAFNSATSAFLRRHLLDKGRGLRDYDNAIAKLESGPEP